MNDDRISQDLHQQAEGITLTPADPAGAMRRGTRRRTRRRVGLLGSVAVVGVLATSIAVRDGSDDQKLDLANGATASASTFDWSVVTPQSGLAWGGDTVLLADGSVYGISTAPGPVPTGRRAAAPVDALPLDRRCRVVAGLACPTASARRTWPARATRSTASAPRRPAASSLSASSDGAGSWSVERPPERCGRPQSPATPGRSPSARSSWRPRTPPTSSSASPPARTSTSAVVPARVHRRHATCGSGTTPG